MRQAFFGGTKNRKGLLWLLAILLISSVVPGCGEPSAEPIEVVLPMEWPNETKFAIGDRLPEIEGVDIDGLPMRLSDYRGKVVLLVFWANW